MVEATAGGVRRHLQTILPGLRERGHEIALVYASERADPGFHQDVAGYEAAGICCHQIFLRRMPHPSDLRARCELRNFAAKWKPEVVHCHATKAGLIGRMLGVDCAVAYSPHAFLFQGARGFKRVLLRQLERFRRAQIDRLICVSAAEEQLAIDSGLFTKARTAVATNGVAVPEPANREKLRQELALAPGDFAIGSLARLAPQKCLATGLRALALVAAEQRMGMRLFLWGDGPEEPHLRALADDLGVASCVRWCGHRTDARSLLPAMDLGLLTSQFEGLSYQLLETLAVAVPVVASDIPGNRLVEPSPGVVYAPVGDCQAFADRLSQLEQETLAERTMRGQAGRALIRDYYSLTAQLDQLETIYQHMSPS